MSIYSENSVKEITEKLISIAGLKKGEKLSISSNKCEFKIQSSWLFQGIVRFKDKRQDTIEFLENLYNKAVGECERLSSSEPLLIVGTPGKTYMTTLENKNYQQSKELIDRLCMRIENSILGLQSLKETYPDVPTFVSLIDQSQHCVKITKTFLSETEKRYKKMRILSSPLEIIEDKHSSAPHEEKKSSTTTITSLPITITPSNISPAFTNNNASVVSSPASVWTNKPSIVNSSRVQSGNGNF